MAKEKSVVLVVSGICSIFFKGDRFMPGDSFEVAESDLEIKSIESLIVRGDLTIKDNSSANEEIKERAAKNRRKDPRADKSRAELEDGGEYQ